MRCVCATGRCARTRVERAADGQGIGGVGGAKYTGYVREREQIEWEEEKGKEILEETDRTVVKMEALKDKGGRARQAVKRGE